MVRKPDGMRGILEPPGLLQFWDSYYNGKGEIAKEAEAEMPQLVKDIAANFFGFWDVRQNAVFALDLLLTPPKETEEFTRIVELGKRKTAMSTKVMEALATLMFYEELMRKPGGGVLGYEGEYQEFQRV
ncbi:MAG: hypothetical protein WC759_04535, partial [Candidatus Micrarchaeia archaeon]